MNRLGLHIPEPERPTYEAPIQLIPTRPARRRAPALVLLRDTVLFAVTVALIGAPCVALGW